MRRFLINFFLMLILGATAHGTNYFVSTTGNDLSLGVSELTAWKSVDRGEQLAVLVPGDTVNILPGVYNPTATYQMHTAGAAGAPIVYRAYGPGATVLDCSASGNHDLEIIADYVNIEGLEILNGPKAGIRITSDYCTVRGCYIHDLNEQGINSVGRHIIIERNIIANTGKAGIEIDAEDNLTFHNVIYYPSEQGIVYKGGITDGRAFNNIVIGASEGIRGKSTIVAGFNALWLNSSDYTDGVTDSAGGLLVNPLLMDPAGGDFSLQATSPCINAGFWFDQSYYGAAPDMGAVELLQIGGSTYYVTTAGSDMADGLTELTAWATIDNGDRLGVLLPGDTVNILAGLYTITDSIYLRTSGSASDRVVYRAVTDTVEIDAFGITGNYAVGMIGSHQTVSGLEIYSAAGDGVWVVGDSNIVSGCFVHDVGGDAIDVGGNEYAAVASLLYRNIAAACNEQGIEVDSAAPNCLIYNNTVYSNSSNGVNLLGSAGSARIFNNIIVLNQRGIIGAGENICGFNDVFTNSLGNYTGGVADSAGGIAKNAVFQNASGDDFSLKSGSPCIDSGLYIGYPYFGTAPDMGAIESITDTPPVLAPISDTSTTEWVNLTFGVSATDAESTPFLTTSSLPSGAGFTDNGDGTGDFDWTPSYPQAGEYSITFYATDDSSAVDSAVVQITVDSAVTAYIEISPDTASLSTDSSLTFTINGFTDSAQASRPGDLTWSLTDPLGSISDSGLFEPTTPGTTKVVATSSLGPVDTSGTITVVAGSLAELTVSPDSTEITTDSTATFSVTGVDADGNSVGVGAITWTLTDSVGFINGAGLFTPTSSGSTRVIATSSLGGVVDTNKILIVSSGEIVRLEISPSADTLAHGDSAQFTATGYDAIDSPTPTGPIDWAVLGSIGTIDTNGWFHATGSGAGYVIPTASLHGLADTSGLIAVAAMSIEAIPLGNEQLTPGGDEQPILAFKLTNSLSSGFDINGLSVRDASRGAGSLEERLGNLDSLRLYRDVDSDNTLTVADLLLTAVDVVSEVTHLDFGPITIGATSSQTFFLAVDAAEFPRDGDSLDFYLLPDSDIDFAGDSTEILGSDSVNSSGLVLLDGMVSSQLTLTITGVATIIPGASPHHVLTLDLPRNGYTADILNSLSIVNLGSAVDSDFDSLVLYRDDGTGVWEGEGVETRVSRLWYTGNQWTGSGLSVALTNQTTRFFVGVYLAAYPTNGATLALTVPINGVGVASQNDGPLDITLAPVDTISIVTLESVVIQAVSISSQDLVPGSVSSQITGLNLTNGFATSVGVDSLRLTLHAGGDTDATADDLNGQVDSLRLYLNRDNDNSKLSVIDSLLASSPVVEGQALLATPGLNLNGGGGSAGLSVVAFLNLRNCHNGNTINIGLEDSTHLYLSSAYKLEGTFPLLNNVAHVIDIFPAEAIVVNPVEGTTLYGAQTNQTVIDFELPRNGYAADYLKRLELVNVGTVRSESALSRCRLFADISNNGFTDDDFLIGPLKFEAGEWEFTGPPFALTDSLTRLLVVVDITSDQSAGGTLQFQIPVGGAEYLSGATGPDDFPVGNPETHLVFPSNRVTAISIHDVTRSIYPGSEENVLLTFALYNGYIGQERLLKTLAIDNQTRTHSDAIFADSVLGQVSLYSDADNSRDLDGDPMVASGYFSDGHLVFSGLDIALPAESLSYFFVVADLSLNSIDSDSLAVSIEGPSDFGFSEETIVNGDLPLVSGGYLVVDGSVAAQYGLPALVPRTLRPGDTSVTLFAFQPAANGDQIDTLEAITLVNLLDATTDDIETLEFWRDLDGDGVWQATDSFLATGAYGDSGWTAGGLSLEITKAVRPVIFAVGDVSATATPNAAFKGALPENACTYASGNDGPINHAVAGGNTFTVSNSGLRVSSPPLEETYSVGQTIEVSFTATNVQTVAMSDVSGKTVNISSPSRVALVDSVSGPVSLPSGGSTDFSFQYTALQPGEVYWQVRAVAPSFPDSSALIQTNTVNIQASPSVVTARLVNSIPTAVTRGQTNVFPMTVNFAHPDTASSAASLRLDSLRLVVEDGNLNPLNASDAFNRLVLATGFSVLSIIDSVPDQSSVLFEFSEPIFVAPGEERSFSLLVDIDSSALAADFALSLQDPAGLPIVDKNTLQPVALNPTINWPLRTASCRIENPSEAGAVYSVSLLKPQVNYGQLNVPMLQMNLRHPGSSGSSQIQLTKLSLAFVDDTGAVFEPGQLFDEIRLMKQQSVIASAAGPGLQTAQLDLSLNSPVTLGAGQTDSVIIAGTVRLLSSVSGFRLVISDSTRLVIRDVSSGFRLEAETDNLATSTSAFPATSGLAQLRERAAAPQVCIQSMLPASIIGGVDSLSMVEYRLVYDADATSSPVRLSRAGFAVYDSAGTPLDPTRLFDRIGYRAQGEALNYQQFVEISNGATVVNLADSGLIMQPGDSLTLELMADIEADVPYRDFYLQVRFDDALSLCDATDTTQSPGITSMIGCSTGLPYSTGLTHIFLSAGRPGLRPPEARTLMAGPGQTDVHILEADLAYESESPQGDLSLEGITGRLLKRTPAGLTPVQGAGLFSAVTLTIDGSAVAVDSLLEGDSIVCRLGEQYSLSRGHTVPILLSCDIRSDVVPGNYIIEFTDSTFLEVSDLNLSGAIYPILTGADYPVTTAELSISAAGLESSFTNYPNPFNPSRGEETIIGYTLEEPAQIDIELFTITGEAVKDVLIDAYRDAGTHQSETWSGINDKGQDVVPGTYFCRITVRYASGRTETLRRKIAVVR